MHIDRNMQVPEESVIHSLWINDDASEGLLRSDAVESLKEWKHSDGEAVGDRDVRVEARGVPGRLIALVTAA